MNLHAATTLLIKGVIFDLPANEQEKVSYCAEQIRTAVAQSGVHGALALALVGAEAAEQAD